MQSKYEPLVLAQCDFIEEIENVKRVEDAKQLTLKRKTEIDVVNANFNIAMKNYIDSEDQYLKDIQAKSEQLNHLMDDGLKLLEKKAEAQLDMELTSAQKEFKQLEQQQKENEDKDEWAKTEKDTKQKKLGKLVEEIQLSVLAKLDVPEPDNKTGVIFNWISGCLICKKMGAVQLAEALQLKVDRIQLQPESIINQPAPPQSGGIFACGGRKPQSNARPMKRQALPEEEQRYVETLFAWKAIKGYVFHQDFKFQDKVKEFIKNFEKLEPYQIMLVEEMVSEKKEIIKGIFDIDIKDQARIIIEINEIVLHFLLDQQKQQEEKKKEQQMENLDKNLRQKNIEIQIMQQQKAYTQAKEKRVSAVKTYFTQIQKHTTEIIQYTKDKISGNDTVIQQIEMARTTSLSKELKVNQDVEEYYRRKRQEMEEKLFEEDQKRQALEQLRLREEEEKQKQKQNQQVEQKEENQFESNQNDEIQPEVQQENEYETDSQYSDQDGEEKQDWIAPAQDEETRHIQQTLFPDKLKTAENKNLAKQKNQAESLLTLMAKRKKN